MTAPVAARTVTYEQYVQEHTVLTAAALALIRLILAPYRIFALPLEAWLGVLSLLFPIIDDYRRQSAELAREFYDSERRDKTQAENPHPIYLAEYEPDWFQEAMEPVRKEFSIPDATEGAEAKVLSRVAKEIENGGRRTTLRAVEGDPEVVGWARVQGGEDSCAFCAMLISRGPVYQFADTAGLDMDDTTAVELFRQSLNGNNDGQMDELMTRWHPNCDCKVVPVFDRGNWPGRDEYLNALELWKEATKDGSKGQAALNNLRRLIHDRRNGDEEIPLAA